MNNEISQNQFIAHIKEKVRAAQYEALKAVNVQLINLYWELGKAISEKQTEGWGKAIVPTLSLELQREFPDMTGFSTTNLWYMVQFFNEYQGDANLQPLVGEISRTKHPIGVATYNTSKNLPVTYKSLLPSAEAINEKLMYFFKNSKLEN